MAASAFIDEGYEVSRPLMDGLEYDLIVVKDNQMSRVQVKVVTRVDQTGALILSLMRGSNGKRAGRRFYESVEIFVGVETTSGSIWKYPIDEIKGKRAITVSHVPAWRNPLPPPTPVTVFSRRDRGTAELEMLAIDESTPPYVKGQSNPRLSHTIQSKLRQIMADQMPPEKPSSVTQQDWWLLTKFMQGYGSKSLARHLGLDPSSVKSKLKRLVDRLTRTQQAPAFTIPIDPQEEAAFLTHPPQ
jgi:hypothetical protein